MHELPLPHFHSGKVRDTYELPGFPEHLLMVASDRISTHNVVHETLMPDKGELLTALTVFWTLDVLKWEHTHLEAFGSDIYGFLPNTTSLPEDLHLRAVVVRRRNPHPVEFVWRRYLVGSGSLWKAYQAGKDPYGLKLPAGLKQMHRFTEPVFTPTEKSETDDPMLAGTVIENYPLATVLTQGVFEQIEAYLATRGITLLDSKMEADGRVLIDEWGTGDCSRMAWSREVEVAQKAGTDPRWLDKEAARQTAEKRWGDGRRVPLTFSLEEVCHIMEPYYEAFEAITGTDLESFQKTYLR